MHSALYILYWRYNKRTCGERANLGSAVRENSTGAELFSLCAVRDKRH